MTHKVYVVTDLGPGDGGKGGVVHKLATMLHAHTVIKDGAAQGSHGVRTSTGLNFAFSQWGCGTLEGIPSFMGPRFIASPEAFLNEGLALRAIGVAKPFAMLTVDERCLCATHYHGIASRLKELARGGSPRGTIGTGVGESYRYAQRFPALAIRAGDLAQGNLRECLAAVRDEVRKNVAPLIEHGFLDADREIARENIALLYDDDFLDFVTRRFQEAGAVMQVVDESYFGRVVLKRSGVAVVERSHGVLTDEFMGFHPHTSAIRTLPRFATAMLRGAGYDGQIVNLGVHRAYSIRHGAGPMPTADPHLGEHLLPGSHKDDNRWQGNVRVGALDMPLIRYAINACGGANAFDGLAITWFDQVVANGEWNICQRYASGTSNRDFFTPHGELKTREGDDHAQLEFTQSLGAQLHGCVPEIEVSRVPTGATRDQLARLCAASLNERLGVLVRLVSLGPTENDKVTI